MLKLVEVAQYLTNKFNEIGATHEPAYSFNIQAEVGANKNAVDVQGIVKTAKPKLPPVLAGRNATYNLIVELSVVAPTSNFNLKNIEEIVNSFASEVNGQEIAFENGKGLVTLTLGQVAEFKTEVGQGNIVPLNFDMVINYTEGVATSKSKHWFLQVSTDTHGDPVYEEIPYISESVLINKEGRTNKINGKKYSETFALGQQKRYRFTFLYDENSLLCPMIQKDMLDGKGNKTYKLKYYDGITYTAESPYVTTVMLFETGDTKSQKPEVAQFDITFADADDGEHTTKYYLALLDNPFDEATENTKCFEETTETITIEGVSQVVHKTAAENQIEWYNGLIQNNGVPENEIPACNISSVYLTNQTYVNTQNSDLFDIVNKNYARIRVETTTPGVEPIVENKYFYYWTKNPAIGMEGQVTFDLSLDSLQTFLFQDGIKFEGNLVERACLNRWVEVPNDPTSVMFDGKATSKLFERENLKQVAKRLVSRQKMKFWYGNAELTEFFNDNVIAWCYVILKRTGPSTNGNYPIYDANGTLSNLPMSNTKVRIIDTYYPDLGDYSYLDYNAHCTLVFPIVRRKININITYQQNIIAYIDENIDNINKLFGGSETSASPYIVSVKLSCKPPFKPNDIPMSYDISGSDPKILRITGVPLSSGVIDIDNETGQEGDYARLWKTTSDHAVILYRFDWMEGSQVNTETNATYKFLKSNVTGTINSPALKNKNFNPKLNSLDYKSCTINMYGSTQEFDMQKLNTKTPSFLYSEAMTMDLAKYKIIPTTSDTSAIYGGTNQNTSYNGMIGTNDTSIELSTDQYDTYIANNKNFFMSFQNQQNQQWRDYLFSAGNNLTNGIMSGNFLGVLSSMTGSGMQAGQLATRQAFDIKQRDLTLDDMKAAPDTVTNANGNAVFNTTSGDIAPYMELYEALPHELEMANDDMFMNGFTYNLNDDIFPYVNKINSVHLRKNFNYIQAIIGNISGITISNEARNDLRQRLANGVRFWHINNIDYVHENSERWLSAPVVSGYASFTTTAQYVGYYVIYKEELTLVTTNNKDNLDITAGTTIAYSNVA